MKKILLILTLIISTGLSSFSQQDDDTLNDKRGRLLERMEQYIQKRLNLSKSESEKFSPVFLRYITELRKTHRDNRNDRPVLQLRIAEVRVKYRDEFRKFLDEPRANRVFDYQAEFERKVRLEILERQKRRRQGATLR